MPPPRSPPWPCCRPGKRRRGCVPRAALAASHLPGRSDRAPARGRPCRRPGPCTCAGRSPGPRPRCRAWRQSPVWWMAPRRSPRKEGTRRNRRSGRVPGDARGQRWDWAWLTGLNQEDGCNRVPPTNLWRAAERRPHHRHARSEHRTDRLSKARDRLFLVRMRDHSPPAATSGRRQPLPRNRRREVHLLGGPAPVRRYLLSWSHPMEAPTRVARRWRVTARCSCPRAHSGACARRSAPGPGASWHSYGRGAAESGGPTRGIGRTSVKSCGDR